MRSESSNPRPLTRREAIQLGARVGVSLGVGASLGVSLAPHSALAQHVVDGLTRDAWQGGPLILRTIPSSGERIPAVGLGTARSYDVTTDAEKAPLFDVIRRLPELGGKLIDTAPAYGQAESVVGELVAKARNRDALFLATKVSVRGTNPGEGVAQMGESFRKLQTDHVDLMQVWNLGGTETLLPVLREMKASKKIRYIGVTTSSERQYGALEALMRKETLDFIQLDYTVDNRVAAERILPLAQDKGIGVLVNLPFGRGRVFQNVLGKPIPDWAAEFGATSWAQVFLKYIVSNPAVTCVIPGTATMAFLQDNQAAGHGALPNEAQRKKIEAAVGTSA
jgi:aryl-alcohol dehydrogenase-like predicted oxidoreductase